MSDERYSPNMTVSCGSADQHQRHTLRWVAVVMATVLLSLVGMGASPAHAVGTRPALDVNDLSSQVSDAAGAKLGRYFGCVAHPGGAQLVLLVTAKRVVAPARRIIARLHADGQVKVRVIDQRNSTARIQELWSSIVEAVGLLNPDLYAVVQTDNSGQTTCGTVQVTLSTAAPAWVSGVATAIQPGNGPDRLTVSIVPPEQMQDLPRRARPA
jgi:hypothetical protein